jgi:general secretion pathway protein H
MRTPTFRAERQPAGEAGFTLIELLAVIAVLALAAGAFIYAGSRSMETSRFRAFMVNAAALLREARTDAIAGHTETVVLIDPGKRRITRADTGETASLPAGAELAAEVAEEEAKADGSAGVRFYPGGNSSGAALTLSYRGRSYEIRVNWLTGNVATAGL